jgi:uncharacterized protein (TIGR04255 family)
MIFPHKEHRIYNSTFLRNIELRISYSRNENFDEWMTHVQSKWDNLDAPSEITINDDSLIISSPNHFITVKADNCVCRFNPNHYTSFGDATRLIIANEALLVDLVGNKVKSAQLKKINIISATKQNDATDYISILSNLFSDDLVRDRAPRTAFDKSVVAKMTQTVLRQDDYELSINYGFSADKTNAKQVIGILELAAIESRCCNFSDFTAHLSEMNAIIFDMFNWCISPVILNLMTEG